MSPNWLLHKCLKGSRSCSGPKGAKTEGAKTEHLGEEGFEMRETTMSSPKFKVRQSAVELQHLPEEKQLAKDPAHHPRLLGSGPDWVGLL